MNSKKFANRMKDSGVSPVIATILMVAITAVLAALLHPIVSRFMVYLFAEDSTERRIDGKPHGSTASGISISSA